MRRINRVPTEYAQVPACVNREADHITENRTRSASSREAASRAEILGLLAAAGPLSRGEIAKRLGLGAATVTSQVRSFLADGLVRDLPAQQSAGAGRPRVPVELVADAVVVIGLDIGPRSVVAVTMLVDGAVLNTSTRQFDPDAEPVPQLASMVAEQMSGLAHPERTVAVGVSVSGAVDRNSSTVVISATLNWQDFDLGRQLQREVALPVFVSNDLFASATRELSFGLGRQHDDFLLMGLGPGVGLGIVNRRSVFYGPDGASTEFGHISVDQNGPRCVCGNAGCLQVYAGLNTLLATAPGLGAERTLEKMVSISEDTGSEAADYLRQRGRILGRALGGVVNLLGISTIIVTGETTALWDCMRGGVEDGLQETVLRFHHPLTIIVKEWTPTENAIAAAGLALHNAMSFAASGRRGSEKLPSFEDRTVAPRQDRTAGEHTS